MLNAYFLSETFWKCLATPSVLSHSKCWRHLPSCSSEISEASSFFFYHHSCMMDGISKEMGKAGGRSTPVTPPPEARPSFQDSMPCPVLLHQMSNWFVCYQFSISSSSPPYNHQWSYEHINWMHLLCWRHTRDVIKKFTGAADSYVVDRNTAPWSLSCSLMLPDHITKDKRSEGPVQSGCRSSYQLTG